MDHSLSIIASVAVVSYIITIIGGMGMKRLKFEMWRYERKPGEFDGYITEFTDGKGLSTESWWNSPPDSIDHTDITYLQGRHGNVRTKRHESFVKEEFKKRAKRVKEES